MSRRRLAGGALVLLAVVIGIGVYVYKKESEPEQKRGSASVEFDRSAGPGSRLEQITPWPMYGADLERTHVAPGFHHRPPYRRVWSVNSHNTIEFPPSVGYGHVYVPQQKGLFLAIDSRTGRVAWRRNFHRCAASSPTLRRGVVYQAYMDIVNCPQDRPGATGFVIAMNARTGHQLWRFKGAPFESSPLLVRHTLYVGSWDHGVYALNARTGRKRWRFEADDQVNTSAAYWRRTIYIASDGGSVYALNARTGKLRWQAHSNSKFGSREFFYATPTVAYGRVFIGNTDGTMYVFGARSGKLLWARPLGTYVYGAAAVWHRTVYVGTYDGSFYALDAATGDVKWKRTAPGAVHAAATVMDGIVYYATCSTCGSAASRTVKRGPDGTWALDAQTGHLVWHFKAGKYANPVIADSRRIYLTGWSSVYGLAERRGGHRRHQR